MTDANNWTKWKAWAVLLLVFALSILVRLPNLNRALAKHHEFLPAVVLINAESWKQAGGGSNFHFTPIMNYQNIGDKVLDLGPNIDKKGNILYLSLGPGWYIIPYSFFEAFNLPPTPFWLRLLNLFFCLITLVLCFIFFDKILPIDFKSRFFVLISGCIIIIFSPGVLWYTGNGYTHTAVMLPFILVLSMILFPMFQSVNRVTNLRLLALLILIIVNLYMDWFVIFIGLCSLVLCLYKIKEHNRYLILAIVIAFSLIAGISLIAWQYSSYVGSFVTWQYWKLRFFDRSFVSKDAPLFTMLFHLCVHYITSYLPLFMGTFFSAIILPTRKIFGLFSKEEKTFICVFGCAILLCHLTLLNWSYVHEFSVIPSCVLLGYIFMRLVFANLEKTRSNLSVSVTFFVLLLSIGQYYFINRPGSISLKKLPYDTYEILGNQMRGIDRNYKIFISMSESNPMIEYYAKRNLNKAVDTFQVKRKMEEWGLKEAIWVEQNNYKLKLITHIFAD